MKKLSILLLPFVILFYGCSSELSPSQLSIADNGIFVDQTSQKPLRGTLLVDKKTGEMLSVEFDDGLPNGDIIMRNSHADVILQANVLPADSETAGWGISAINHMLKKNTGAISTHDYLKLIQEFSVFDGKYSKTNKGGDYQSGEFDQGNKVGLWQHYCKNNQLKQEVTYKKLKQNDNINFIKVGKEQTSDCDGNVMLSAKRNKKGQLHGEYIENSRPSNLLNNSDKTTTIPRHKRYYKNGELDGLQTQYTYLGLLDSEINYKYGVKHGVAKTYKSTHHPKSDKPVTWLSIEANYLNGQLDGPYQSYQQDGRIMNQGRYQAGKEVGLWKKTNAYNGSVSYTDHKSDNFIMTKRQGFSKACYLPYHSYDKLAWAKKQSTTLSNCEYYVQNSVVNINKKLGLDSSEPFTSSSNWTYPAIVAPDAVYQLMKQHGLRTEVTDSQGQTRLHMCINLMRKNPYQRLKCTEQQALSYLNDVNINQLSTHGSVLHQVAENRLGGYHAKAAKSVQLVVAKALINHTDSNLDLLNNQQQSALMVALLFNDYAIAELLLDAGANTSYVDKQGHNAIFSFFLNNKKRLVNRKIGADGERVLAKLLANGANINSTLPNQKNITDLIEETNTLFHFDSIKAAKAMAANLTPTTKVKPVVQQHSDQATGEFSSIGDILEKRQQLATQQTNPVTNNQSIAPITTTQTTDSLPSNANQQPANNVTELVKKAKQQINELKLQTPKNDSALTTLNQLRALQPNDPGVLEIQTAIGIKYFDLAVAKARKGHNRSAKQYIESAKKFVTDRAIMDQYQQKFDQIAQSGTAHNGKTRKRNNLSCTPQIKAKGIPMVGRRLTAMQTVNLSRNKVMRHAVPYLKNNFSNTTQRSDNYVQFSQIVSYGKVIQFELTVEQNGSSSDLLMSAKVPIGLMFKKANFQQGFCQFINTL